MYRKNPSNDINLFAWSYSNLKKGAWLVGKASTHSWVYPGAPWERIHIDLAKQNKDHYLSVMDAFSKWPEVCFLGTDTRESRIIQELRQKVKMAWSWSERSLHLCYTGWKLQFEYPVEHQVHRKNIWKMPTPVQVPLLWSCRKLLSQLPN